MYFSLNCSSSNLLNLSICFISSVFRSRSMLWPRQWMLYPFSINLRTLRIIASVLGWKEPFLLLRPPAMMTFIDRLRSVVAVSAMSSISPPGWITSCQDGSRSSCDMYCRLSSDMMMAVVSGSTSISSDPLGSYIVILGGG